MEKYVKNISTGQVTKISGMKCITIFNNKISNGSMGHKVACFKNPGVGFSLAEFSNLEDANECLAAVTDFWVANDGRLAPILEVDDKVVATLIEIAGAKDVSKNFVK